MTNINQKQMGVRQVRDFLLAHDDVIQERAVQLHEEFLDGKECRSEVIKENKNIHIQILEEIASHLEKTDIETVLDVVKKLAKKRARRVVKEGIDLDEALHGVIFLNQAIWEKVHAAGLLAQITTKEFYSISQKMSAYIDTLSAELTIAYQADQKNKLTEEIGLHGQLEQESFTLGAIVNSSHDAIISKTLQGVIKSWNKAAEKIFGFSAEEAIGKHITMIIPPELRHEEEMIIGNIRNGIPIDHYDTVRLTKDGRRIHVSLTISPVKDAKGNIIGASKIARDITERKRQEENLAFISKASKILSSSLDYKKTLQNITKLIVNSLATWCIVDMLQDSGEAELLAIAHRDPKQVKWAKEYRSFHPVDMSSSTGVSKVLKTGKSEFYPVITDEMLVAGSRSEEELILARNLKIISAMTVPMCIKGKCIGAITFIATAKDKPYTELDLFFAEEICNRAALAIENANLYTNTKEAMLLRDEFISVASHELKTPVTSLKMYTQVLRKELAKENTHSPCLKYFGRIDDQANKLTILINDLLNVSKHQHGRLDFSLGEFDLNELVEETSEELKEIGVKHTITIEGSIPKKVRGDRYRISQVLMNLLTNAMKYSPRANTVIVELTPENDRAVVSVNDFGIGIEKEQQKKIFQQFYRVDTSDTRTFPGMGVGLYIASEIVRRHGGELTVVSEVGKGSLFSFSLPYAVFKIDEHK